MSRVEKKREVEVALRWPSWMLLLGVVSEGARAVEGAVEGAAETDD